KGSANNNKTCADPHDLQGSSNKNSNESTQCMSIEPTTTRCSMPGIRHDAPARPTAKIRAPGCSPVNNNKTMGQGLITHVGRMLVMISMWFPYKCEGLYHHEVCWPTCPCATVMRILGDSPSRDKHAARTLQFSMMVRRPTGLPFFIVLSWSCAGCGFQGVGCPL